MPERKKNPWLRRLEKAGALAVLLAVALALAGKFWILPSVIRGQVETGMAECWIGQAEVQQVEFNWFGPIRLRGVSVRDEAGRIWARTAAVTLTLRDWPGLHPMLTGVAVDRVDLRAHFENGACRLPLKLPFKPSRLKDYVDLQFVEVGDVSVGLSETGGPELVWDGFRCRVERDGRVYAAFLTRPGGAPPSGSSPAAPATSASRPDSPPSRPSEDRLELACRADGDTLECTLTLSASLRLGNVEGAQVADILNLSSVRDFQGVLSAETVSVGCLREPLALNHRGTVRLEDWRVSLDRGTIARGVGAEIRLGGRRFEAGEITGDLAGGRLGGGLLAVILPDCPDNPVRYSGELTVRGVRLADLDRLLSDSPKIRAGLMNLRWRPVGDWTGLEGLRTVGVVQVDDADFRRSDLLRDLLAAGGIELDRLTNGTDLYVVFRSRGAEATVEQGQLGNSLSAVVAEPGGTVDLRRRELDLHVVVAPLSAVRTVMSNVPIPLLGQVFKGATAALDAFTRVRVQGPWDKPQIRKEPLKDLQAGTLELFGGIVSGGGQLGKGLFDSVGGLLKALEGGKDKSEKNNRQP